MTCVLGMAVRREREIREFVKTPFYRVIGTFLAERPEGEEVQQRAAGGPLARRGLLPCRRQQA